VAVFVVLDGCGYEGYEVAWAGTDRHAAFCAANALQDPTPAVIQRWEGGRITDTWTRRRAETAYVHRPTPAPTQPETTGE
jgi:hypothetical protein